MHHCWAKRVHNLIVLSTPAEASTSLQWSYRTDRTKSSCVSTQLEKRLVDRNNIVPLALMQRPDVEFVVSRWCGDDQFVVFASKTKLVSARHEITLGGKTNLSGSTIVTDEGWKANDRQMLFDSSSNERRPLSIEHTFGIRWEIDGESVHKSIWQ